MKFTDTQLAICVMRYKRGYTKTRISSLNGLSQKEVANEIKAILLKVGVTSELAAGYQLTKAGLI